MPEEIQHAIFKAVPFLNVHVNRNLDIVFCVPSDYSAFHIYRMFKKIKKKNNKKIRPKKFLAKKI